MYVCCRWNDSDHAVPVESYVEEWLSLGVDLVGGCCRTTADDTKLMRARVDAFNAQQEALFSDLAEVTETCSESSCPC